MNVIKINKKVGIHVQNKKFINMYYVTIVIILVIVLKYIKVYLHVFIKMVR